jgi:hypothetical protein
VLRPDPHYRPFKVAPQWPITIEIRCRDGSCAIVHGTIDSVPSAAGEHAQHLVVVDATAEPL